MGDVAAYVTTHECHLWPAHKSIGLVIILTSIFSNGLTGHLSDISVTQSEAAAKLLSTILCSRIPGLTEEQRAMCQDMPEAMAAVGDGVRMAHTECKHLFRNHRWNCTAIGRHNTFAHVVVIGSKEAAIVYGMWSAGMTYAITAACMRGSIAACGCRPGRTGRAISRVGWKWGGCSPDVDYGATFTRRFTDSREMERDARSLMNLHNNRAGRKAVKSTLQMECKCHGVSGSCTLRTCWETLATFREISELLYHKYTKARPVIAVVPHSTRTRSTLHKPQHLLVNTIPRVRSFKDMQLMALNRGVRRSEPMSWSELSANINRIPKRGELVFLESSPNYCERDFSSGSLGTQSRQCNRTSQGPDSCDLLCCGRGYNTHQVTKSWKCRCRFHWCCSVFCDTCTQRFEEYTCK